MPPGSSVHRIRPPAASTVWLAGLLAARANLTLVRALRVCLLVLLAVLLPVRGAVAAAMLCAASAQGMHSELRAQDHRGDHAATDHGVAHDHASGAYDDGRPHGSSDKCNLCSACCSTPPLASEVPTLPGPIELAAVRFPALQSLAPSFLSDGQERPPRSI